MGKVINFPEQYDGDLFVDGRGQLRGTWWIKPSIWRNRYVKEASSRPTAGLAEKNVYYQAKGLARYRRWRDTLTEHENQAIAYEIRYIREHRHPDPTNAAAISMYHKDKMAWVTGMMGKEFSPQLVAFILEQASLTLMELEYCRLSDLLPQIERRYDREFKKLVREVLHEEKQKQLVIAA